MTSKLRWKQLRWKQLRWKQVLGIPVLSAVMFAPACGGKTSSDRPTPSAVVRTARVESSPSCPAEALEVRMGWDRDGDGELSDDEEARVEILCDGAALDGATALVDVLNSARCEGGQTIVGGFDADGNGVLDAEEVTSQSELCPASDTLQEGALLVATTESEGRSEACPGGGVWIRFGVDEDRDGALADSEVDSEELLCNGSGVLSPDGSNGALPLILTSDEPPGTRCPTGGLYVVMGLDESRDGVLEGDEIWSEDWICNGLPATTQDLPDPECTSGTRGCNGRVPQQCVAGRWIPGSECTFDCSEGHCVGECSDGDVRCSGDAVERCVGGDWARTECPLTCREGVCVGFCEAGETRCATPADLATCDSAGEWQAAEPCTPDLGGFACIEGSCTGTCVPGAEQCEGNEVQACSDRGDWVTTDDCASSDTVCRDGRCTANQPYVVGYSQLLPETFEPSAERLFLFEAFEATATSTVLDLGVGTTGQSIGSARLALYEAGTDGLPETLVAFTSPFTPVSTFSEEPAEPAGSRVFAGRTYWLGVVLSDGASTQVRSTMLGTVPRVFSVPMDASGGFPEVLDGGTEEEAQAWTMYAKIVDVVE